MESRCYVTYFLTAILAFTLFVGCSDVLKDENKSGTAVLQINIPLPESSMFTKATVVDTDAESDIKTLRILIFAEDENVDGIFEKEVCNRLFNKSDLTGGQITIEDVPIGEIAIYAIANEASLGIDYTDTEDWNSDIVEVGGKRKILIIDGFEPRKFPMKAVPDFQNSEAGLPMSGFVSSYSVTTGSNEVEISLRRAVSKINLNIEHGYDQDVSVSSISFGPFFGDRFYLFQEGARLEVPSDSDYRTAVYDNLSILLPPKENVRTISLYVYPSFARNAGQGPAYTIGFETTAGFYPPKDIGITQLMRNTVIDIDVYLSETNISFDYEVQDWTDKAVDVPAFE